jgi:hypothetical protein
MENMEQMDLTVEFKERFRTNKSSLSGLRDQLRGVNVSYAPSPVWEPVRKPVPKPVRESKPVSMPWGTILGVMLFLLPALLWLLKWLMK